MDIADSFIAPEGLVELTLVIQNREGGDFGNLDQNIFTRVAYKCHSLKKFAITNVKEL